MKSKVIKKKSAKIFVVSVVSIFIVCFILVMYSNNENSLNNELLMDIPITPSITVKNNDSTLISLEPTATIIFDNTKNSRACIAVGLYPLNWEEIIPVTDNDVPYMLPYWEEITEIPEMEYSVFYWEGSRIINENIEFWFDDFIPDIENAIDAFTIYSYNTGETKKIESDGISSIYLQENGDVWGIRGKFFIQPGQPAYLLSTYNDETGKFEPYDIPLITSSNSENFYIRDTRFFDKEGVFWVFTEEYGNFSFNPGEGQFVKRSDSLDYQGFDTLKYLGETTDYFYFLLKDGPSFVDISTPLYYLFKKDTGTFTNIPSPPYQNRYTSSFFIDREGNIIVDFRIIYEINNGEWKYLQEDVELLDRQMLKDQGKSFIKAAPYFQSEDGKIWGISYSNDYKFWGWYDPESGDSCWSIVVPKYFTPGDSGNFIQSPDGNIYFIQNRILYKYELVE